MSALLLLAVSVPACFFCLVVLTKFQNEIRRPRRNKFSAAKVISLDRQQDFFNESRFHNQDFDREEITAPSQPGNSGGLDSESVPQATPEIYQLESAYIGPFFIIPACGPKPLTKGCDRGHRVFAHTGT